jgi:methionyl-tRNA formyltransferase
MSGKVVVLGRDNPSTRIVVDALARRFEIARVILEEPEDRGVFIRRRIKRLGLLTVADQLAFMVAGKLLGRASRRRIAEILARAGLRDVPPPQPLRVTSANAPETLEALRDLKPDVIVVNGTRILSRALLGGAPAPFINMHAGITPLYRGVHGGYWALAQGDPANCGVTVHLVDPGVDTGEVLYQARVQPTPRDSYFTYPYLQLAAGVPLLLRAVEDALQGRLAPMRAQGSSAQWSHPGLTGYLWRRLARGVR